MHVQRTILQISIISENELRPMHIAHREVLWFASVLKSAHTGYDRASTQVRVVLAPSEMGLSVFFFGYLLSY
jgi:hypothetical protein